MVSSDGETDRDIRKEHGVLSRWAVWMLFRIQIASALKSHSRAPSKKHFKLLDPFLVFAGLLPVLLLLGLFRLLADDEGLSLRGDFLRAKVFAAVILAQVDLGQTGGFKDDSKLGFGWPALG